MWCYNILGDNNGSISHILQLHPITTGSILLTSNLVALKKGNREPILTVKGITLSGGVRQPDRGRVQVADNGGGEII